MMFKYVCPLRVRQGSLAARKTFLAACDLLCDEPLYKNGLTPHFRLSVASGEAVTY